MDNAWVVPVIALIVVYSLVGGLLAIFWAMTRYAFRLARRYWPLPTKTWSVLAAGLIMQAVCVLIFVGAIYVPFLPSRPFEPLYHALLASGFIGIGLSSVILVFWLALVRQSQRYLPPLEVFFGHDNKKRRWLIVSIALFPFLIVGQVAGPTHAWLLGVFVAVPATFYVLCIASLLAHSTGETLAGTP